MALTLGCFSHEVATGCSLGREPEKKVVLVYKVLKGRNDT